MLAWKDVLNIQKCCPNLEELHLEGNEIAVLETCDKDQLALLSVLSLANNKVVEWSEVAKLSCLKSLTSVNISGNSISSLKYESGFEGLVYLNFSWNVVNTWESINELNRFPKLKELRFRDNPLVSKLSPDLIRMQIIARIVMLQTLNGSIVTSRERDDAERYYLKQALQEKLELNLNEEDFLRINPRYLELVKLHGEPIVEKPSNNTVADNLIEVNILDPTSNTTKSKKFPRKCFACFARILYLF